MKFYIFVLSLFLVFSRTVFAQLDETTVAEIVKNAPCNSNTTIEDTLKDKIKTGSQRDLGWEVFKENEFYAVERAFLINKSMQIRFRWLVDSNGKITPASKRAESLCE